MVRVWMMRVGVCLVMLGWVPTPQFIIRRPVGTENPIAEGRRMDWSQAGVVGGIPHRTTRCGSTIAPYTGTAGTINTAIAACTAGQFVELEAGTFNLSTGILFDNKDNVTLRGQGAASTYIIFTGSGASCFGDGGDVCFQNGELSYALAPAHSATWSSGFAKGTTQITLSNTTGLVVGNYLVVDQDNDTDTDTGNIWICDTNDVCADEGPSGAGEPGMVQEQRGIVTAINGSVVTISPAIAMPNWSSGKNARAWWASTNIQGSGIEDVSLDHTASSSKSGIRFMNALNCWARGVRGIQSDRAHVWLWEASNIEIRDSYFYGTKNAVSQSYGIEPYMTGNVKIENNIFEHIAAPITVNGPATGSVFAYNYAIDDYFTTSPATMSAMNWLHSAGVDMMLFEGNEGPGWFSDGIHGTHHFVTVYRNYFIGWETGKTAQTEPIIVRAFGRYFNMVGNVLGSEGIQDVYEKIPGGGGTFAIFPLNHSPGSPVPDDSLVKTTLLRWGNYDVVTDTARFLAGEVPSGLSLYANPVPTSQNLPNSQYLINKPGWYGSYVWPPMGPDVTGQGGPGGHVAIIPARDCYDNTGSTGGIKDFDRVTCYG